MHSQWPEAQPWLSSGRDVPRDVFPLPSFFSPDVDDFSGLSHSVKQRLRKRQHVGVMVEECIIGLNALYSGQMVKPAAKTADISAAQRMVHDHILNSVVKLGGPGLLSGTEALKQLRAFDGYGEDQTPCAVQSYTPELLSLPSKGSFAVPLEELLGCDGRNIVGEFIHSRLLNVDEARSKLDRCGVRQPYSDPRLRDPKLYAGFLHRLVDADLVELTLTQPCEIIEAFFVSKKDGRLRMVIDCRRSNCWFAEPDKVALATAECLSRIELEPGSELHVATADLKDAFYHFGLPAELRPFFGMRPIRAGEFGITHLAGVSLKPGDRIFPRLAVLPMGWSHALWFCQMIHQRIVLEAGAERSLCLEDKSAVPDGSVMHLEYVDNYVVLGTNESAVSELASAGATALRDKGLVVHEEEKAEGSIKVLGWQFEKTELKPVPHRVWRVRLAMQRLLQLGSITGRQLEKVVGHATFICLGRRESLSVFGETYTFIHRHYHSPHKLWKSVRRELQIFCSICPLIWRDLSMPWSTEVQSIDASTWGLGATAAEFGEDEVRRLSKFSERWRFDSDVYRNPRASTMGVDVGGSSDDVDVLKWASNNFSNSGNGLDRIRVIPDKPQSEKFMPIKLESLQKSWRMVGRYKWRRLEPIPVLEARAALFGVKHILRTAGNFNKRHLILSDSITAVCSLDRGRGRAFKMRRVSQQVGALCLASNSCFYYRWLPSEWNSADGPSRGSRFPSSIPQTCGDGHTQADHSGTQEEVCPENQSFKTGSCSEAFSSFGGQNSCPQTTTEGCDISQGGVCRRAMQKEISGVLGQADSGNGCEVVYPIKAPTGRQDSGDYVGFNVFGRGGHFASKLHVGGSAVQAATPEGTPTGQSSNCQAKFEGLVKTRPAKIQVATPVGGRMPDGEVHAEQSSEGRGPHDVAGFCGVSEARGADQTEGTGPGASGYGWVAPCPALVSDSPPPGVGRVIKNSRIRRDNSFRPALQQSGGNGSLSIDAFTSLPSQQPDFQQGCGRPQKGHADSEREVQSHKSRGSTPLPTATWRSKQRFFDEAKGSPSNPAAGEVEDTGISQKVSKGRKAHSVAARPPTKRTSTSHESGRSAPKSAPLPALSPGRTFICAVFIEIFSGCGRLGRAVQRVTGWPVLLWDIMLGEEYDLNRACNRRRLVEWVRCGWVVGLHLGTPCESFSRARDVRPGPPPLRSDLQPLGLSDLRPGDQLKVQQGNRFMRFSVHLLNLTWRFNIPATMENPERSRIWLCPPVLQLFRKKHVTFSVTHFCGWGTPWRKATGFLAVHVDLTRLNVVRCSSSKRGICQFSGQPHIHLHGKTSTGQWVTKIAQPYPHRMCNALAKCFYDWEVMLMAQRFAKHL